MENDEFTNGSITSADLDRVLTFFEDSTEYDGTMGAHDVLLGDLAGSVMADTGWGVPTFLFVDVWDEFDLGRNDSDDGLWLPGYTESDDNIIYLDSDPADYSGPASDEETGNGLRGVANLYTRYVVDKLDAFEESWIRMGLAFMGEFMVGSRDIDSSGYVQPDFYDSSPDSYTNGFPGGNSLVFVGSVYKDRVEWEHLYLFFLYVYEKYGEVDMLGDLATSRRVGVAVPVGA